MKKIIGLIFIAGFVAIAVFIWLVLGSATSFTENKKSLYVYTGKANKEEVMNYIKENKLLDNPGLFSMVASRMGVWKRLKPGRFELKKGESILTIARMLRNNKQSPVNLIINKLRTNDDLVKVLAKNFEADSSAVIDFINNSDSLDQLGVNTYTLTSLIIPNTYTILWNTSTGKILRKLKTESDNFWQKDNRRNKAAELGFTPLQVTTIASIVEEETNKNDEKGNIASVYINRYRKGMALGADPTIKFAMHDFALKRIYLKYLDVESPYNTYKQKGLPPGPICTPSAKTIDAVLNSPKTEYLFFVAKSDFSGYHTFSTNYAEHLQHAHEFQKAQDEQAAIRQQKNSK